MSIEQNYLEKKPHIVVPYPFAREYKVFGVISPSIGTAGELPRFFGLRAMDAGWISAPVSGRAPFPEL
jgi:hypothetical protein